MAQGLQRVLDARAANADHQSSAIDVGKNHGSMQVKWAGITSGTGTFKLMVSLNGIDYKPKQGANGTNIEVPSVGAAGNEIYSFNGVLTEPAYRLDWDKGDAAAGTVDAWFYIVPSR